jgi:hypothetical protein
MPFFGNSSSRFLGNHEQELTEKQWTPPLPPLFFSGAV